ncbi:MAG: PQQ-dependent sugar dehydrogenase [Vicinamibacterales bacterium]
MRISHLLVALLLCGVAAAAQTTTTDPFPAPIPTADGVIKVNFVEFASLPDIEGTAARMMLLVDQASTRRMFVNDMRGPLYSLSYDGKTVTPYLDLSDAKWAVSVQSNGSERGFQSFAFHPQFSQPGSRGFGKFYALVDTTNMEPKADFTPAGGTGHTHDTVLLEWTAKTPTAATYDGSAPRELIRWAQPFANHNGGQTAFNPLATPASPDYGLLYQGFGDGGSGGDPLKMAQNRASGFGKILRIDPLGTNSTNGKYGIPASNPFARAGAGTLPELYAIGLRNPQRFAWDSKNGNMFVADIGQDTVEKVSLVMPGANLGWNVWEGSYKYAGRAVDPSAPRSETGITYPVVEYGQADPLFQPNSAVTMGAVYRRTEIAPLTNLLLFGDNPSGEIFYVSADSLPKGGQDAVRRVLFNDKGTAKTLLQLVKEKNLAQGKAESVRVDLRFGPGANGQIFVLNKHDGTIRLLVPTR